MAKAWVGCSGFSYPHWKGTFYPEGLAAAKWFRHYISVFSTVELNVTFYRLPKEKTFEKWYDETPEDFAFSLKGSRFITHIKRLRDPDEPVALFFRHAARLKEKLMVVLWQFPPSFGVDEGRLSGFLEVLRQYPARNAFEFRNESWLTSTVIDMCTEQGVSLCTADSPAFLDSVPATAGFVYVRRHGESGGYETRYSRAQLKKDSRRIKKYLKDGKDVFIYFNNDALGYAPQNALELMDLL